jgi:arogenate dehydrogenase (NADP+)
MDKLDRAFEQVKQMLYGRLHDVLRKQIVERVPVPGVPSLGPRKAQNNCPAAREETNHVSQVADVHKISLAAFSTTKC